MDDAIVREIARCYDMYVQLSRNSHPDSLFSAVYHWCEARRWCDLLADDGLREDWKKRLPNDLPGEALVGAGVGLLGALDRTLRIVGSGGSLIYEEMLLVMTNAVSVEYVSAHLREKGMLSGEAIAKIVILRESLAELAGERSSAYRSALAQMNRAHRLRTEFLALESRDR
jgi:hypothetical protein